MAAEATPTSALVRPANRLGTGGAGADRGDCSPHIIADDFDKAPENPKTVQRVDVRQFRLKCERQSLELCHGRPSSPSPLFSHGLMHLPTLAEAALMGRLDPLMSPAAGGAAADAKGREPSFVTHFGTENAQQSSNGATSAVGGAGSHRTVTNHDLVIPL